MSVVMARIDNRLLHGIIVTQWAPVSGATRVMVIDDKVAGDEVLKSTMRMARPAGMAVSIISEQTALKNFAAGKYDITRPKAAGCPPPLYCKQDIFIFYIQWFIFLLIGNTMKNTMLRKGLTIF